MAYTYEVFMNGRKEAETPLAGIAMIKYQTAKLDGEAMLFRISDDPDPVLGGVSLYNDDLGGWEDFKKPPTEE